MKLNAKKHSECVKAKWSKSYNNYYFVNGDNSNFNYHKIIRTYFYKSNLSKFTSHHVHHTALSAAY